MQKTHHGKYAQLDQYKNTLPYNRQKLSRNGIIFLAFLASFCLGMIIFLGGCIAQITARDAARMTPEQIAAYKDTGMKIFSCFKLSGPPPSGSELFIVLPKEATGEFVFLPDCSIMPTKVTQ